METWCSAQEAAQIIGVTRATIHRWRVRGGVFRDGTWRAVGLFGKEYNYRRDEIERLRLAYGKSTEGKTNGLAVAA